MPHACRGLPLTRSSVAVLASLATLAVGCREVERDTVGSAPGEAVVLHPVPEALRSRQGDVLTRAVSFRSLLDNLPSRFAALTRFDTLRAVGVPDGPDDELIGSAVDATIGVDGRIFLLDRPYGIVRVYTPTLHLLQRVGSFGDGPGQFVEPSAVVTLAEGSRLRLGVVDEDARRVEWFREEEGGFVTSARTQLPLYAPASGCVASERLVVAGLLAHAAEITRENTGVFAENVHELSSTGEVLRSFAAPYSGATTWIIAANMSRAQIACGDELTWAAYLALGEVHAFDARGEVRWIVRITDLDHPGFIQRFRPDGNWSFGLNLTTESDQAIENVSRVALLADDVLAVQLTFTTRTNRSDVRFGTLLLDPTNGRPLGAFIADHMIMAGRAGVALLYKNNPYPRMSVAVMPANEG